MDAQAERVVFTDATGAAIDWTATEEQVPRDLGRGLGGLQIVRRNPAQWIANIRAIWPDQMPFSDADAIEVVLILDGREIDRWEGSSREQVAALIAMMRANDLPVVEAA